MSADHPRVLLVDDEPNIRKTISICLADLGFKVTEFSHPVEAQKAIQRERFDLAFIDLKMTPVDGMTLLGDILHHAPETTVIIITAHGSIDSAVEAIKNGAYHYLQKPFDFIELQLFARKVLEYHRLKHEVAALREALDSREFTGKIVTGNGRTLEMVDLASRVGETDLTVLIEGESGTGKELFARLMYEKSSRNGKSYVRVNCAALPENLLESELFGHVKGAFTGAIKDRRGRFELADGGTIFLDEIGELAPSLQAKLLRVLQRKEYERVGESITHTVDVRVIAATNRNLEEAIKEGIFREDLFYCLNAVRLKLQPLRERPEDIPLLIQHFTDKFAEGRPIEIEAEALAALRRYRWSGNVRELENVMQRLVLLARNNRVRVKDLPEEIRVITEKSVQLHSLEELEEMHIKKILQMTADLSEAAQVLGIDPATLWRKRKKYGLS